MIKQALLDLPFISSLIQPRNCCLNEASLMLKIGKVGAVFDKKWAWSKISRTLCARFCLMHPHTETSSYATVIGNLFKMTI